MELCACPQCGLPAEVVSSTVQERDRASVATDLVGVRCISRHWFFGLRERLVGVEAA